MIIDPSELKVSCYYFCVFLSAILRFSVLCFATLAVAYIPARPIDQFSRYRKFFDQFAYLPNPQLCLRGRYFFHFFIRDAFDFYKNRSILWFSYLPTECFIAFSRYRLRIIFFDYLPIAVPGEFSRYFPAADAAATIAASNFTQTMFQKAPSRSREAGARCWRSARCAGPR